MKTAATILILFVCTFSASAGKSDEAKFDAYVMKHAHELGITVSQVFRLWNVESGTLRDATPDGKLGEKGRAQIMPSTARQYEPAVTDEQLRTKWVNTRILFRHLRFLRSELKRAGVSEDMLPVLMFSAYNSGLMPVLARREVGKKASTSYGRHIAWGTTYVPPKHRRHK